MATISDSKRKQLISKGAKYYDKEGELVEPELTDKYTTLVSKEGARVTREGTLPDGGRIKVESAPDEEIDTANIRRKQIALTDPNSPETKAAMYERVQPLRDKWQAASDASKSRYQRFLEEKGTPVDPFTGDSLVQQERVARRNVELDRNEMGRINRYARMAERGGQPVMALGLRDEVANEFTPTQDKSALIRRYESMIRSNRQRARDASNPL